MVLEEEHTSRFVVKRAARENASCFWAVLQPCHARFVGQLLLRGEFVDSLHWLERLASDVGRIVPPEPNLPEWLPEDVTISDEHDRESSS